MATKNKISAVLDIGTSTVSAMAGFKNEENRIEILGYGSAPARGIKRGLILNLDEFGAVADEMITLVENQFDGRIGEIDVSISGQHIKMLPYSGYRYIGETGKVTREDFETLFKEAEKADPGSGYKVFHCIPGQFKIDDEIISDTPVGYSGNRFYADYNLVCAPQNYETSIRRVFEKLDILVGKVMVAPLAISRAVLTEEEMEEGVVLVDIGAGTTKIAIFFNRSLVDIVVIPFAGNTVTNDIREGCSIMAKWAEQMKVKYGQALGDFAEEEKVVTIPGLNGWEPKEISFKTLAYIIQARMEEIIDSVYSQIEHSGYHQKLGAGIVLTGGSTRMPNLVQLVKYRTGLDARIGNSLIKPRQKPAGAEGSGYYAMLGMLQEALNDTQRTENKGPEKKKKGGGLFSNLAGKFAQLPLMFDTDDAEINKIKYNGSGRG